MAVMVTYHSPTYGRGVCPRCGVVIAFAGPSRVGDPAKANCKPTADSILASWARCYAHTRKEPA